MAKRINNINTAPGYDEDKLLMCTHIEREKSKVSSAILQNTVISTSAFYGPK